jgi:hypothetical protein
MKREETMQRATNEREREEGREERGTERGREGKALK